MLKVKVMMAALTLPAIMLAPANAQPGKLNPATQVTSMNTTIQDVIIQDRDRYNGDRDRFYGDRRDRYGDRDFRDRGDRYYGRGYARREPPRGWHRYGYRPGDWRTRGCIEIGPAWFCP